MFNEMLLGTVDSSLLYALSIDTKTKYLPMAIPLSIAELEKRKRNLKNIFSVSGLEDKSLMNKTREKAFI
jgi:hypothetical protein